jgi:hypothetical protein
MNKNIISPDATGVSDSYFFTLMPNEDLLPQVAYFVVITTVNGKEDLELEGIRWPKLG